MDLIQNYTSDSDSQEEEEEGLVSAHPLKRIGELHLLQSQPLPTPPPIQIFLQQYQNMHSASKVSAIFTSMPWTPSVTALSQLEKAVNYVVSQIPALSQNYKFVAPNKDPFRVEKHHITIFPTLHMKEEYESQYTSLMRERLNSIKPPANLIYKADLAKNQSPLLKLLDNSKPSIRLSFQSTMSICKSPLKDSLFCTIEINQTPDSLSYFNNLIEGCKTSAEKSNAQVQFPELLNDPMHVSVATGYVIRKSMSVGEVDKINQHVTALDISQFTKDIPIVVDELTIRNMYQMTSTSLPLI